MGCYNSEDSNTPVTITKAQTRYSLYARKRILSPRHLATSEERKGCRGTFARYMVPVDG